MLVSSVSFFNDLATEMKNYPRRWFHFLMNLKLKKNMLKYGFIF
jgi:hypothetical protein